MSALNLRVEAPFRPTDWRWEKAILMREDPRTASLLRHQDDDWTRKAKKFQLAYATASSDYDHLLLMRRWPSLAEAYAIRHQDDEKRLLRYEIEARLLSDDPFERVSERVGVSPDVVIWYEKLFFNVRDRLSHRGWVAHCVLGESAHAGLTERDYDVLWKMFGYIGGGYVLDAVIDRRTDLPQPEGPGQVRGWFGDDIEQVSTIKMDLAMRIAAVNSYTIEKIAEIYQRFRELQKMADGAGGGGDMLTTNIAIMLQSIPWTVGDKRVLVAANDPKQIVGRLREDVAAADECAVELRADELMQLNSGQQPDRLSSITAVKFPEKPNAAASQQGS